MAEKSKPSIDSPIEVEKRGVEREPFFCPVFFDWTVRDGKHLGLIRGRGTIINIHAFGVGLINENPVGAGDVLKIYLPVKGTQITLPVFSEVRWVRPNGNRFYAGIQFLG
jgi:PilZ domain